VAFKNTLAYPAKLPLYYGANDWIISTWWFKPQPEPQAAGH
jgi:microcin C transport system substrate-binding protein